MTFIEYYGKRKEVSAGRADSVRTIHIAGWIISLGDQLDADVWLRNFTFAKFGFQEHYFWHKEGNSATAIKEIFQLEWRYPRVNKDFLHAVKTKILTHDSLLDDLLANINSQLVPHPIISKQLLRDGSDGDARVVTGTVVLPRTL